jgi:hypothetical protein
MIHKVSMVTSGWCYLYVTSNNRRVINAGYESWLWGSIVLVLLCTIIFSIGVCHNKHKVRCSSAAEVCRLVEGAKAAVYAGVITGEYTCHTVALNSRGLVLRVGGSLQVTKSLEASPPRRYIGGLKGILGTQNRCLEALKPH